MSDETMGVEENGASMQKWMPAIKAGIVLIAISIAILIFYILVETVLSGYLKPLWGFWREPDMTYPVKGAIYGLLDGVFLLGLAGLIVSTKGWREAFFDELQLMINRAQLNFFLTGLAIGAVGIVIYAIVDTLSTDYLLNEYLYIGLMSGRLAVAALVIIPLLAQGVGQVALVQGYFQRTISKNYGTVAGLIVAAFAYMLLFRFPNLPSVLESARYPDLFLILGAMAVSAFIQAIIVGAILALLFLRSKSLYLPIGFIFAWHLFSYFYDAFVSSSLLGPSHSFLGYYAYLVPPVLQTAFMFLILASIWYFYDSGMDMDWFKGRLQNVADYFRYRDEE